MEEKKPMQIVFDVADLQRIEEAAEKEHLPPSTWCRQKLLMYLEGRLVEKQDGGNGKHLVGGGSQ